MDPIIVIFILKIMTTINFGLWKKSFYAAGVMWGVISLAEELSKRWAHG